jgi:hypothetical protein
MLSGGDKICDIENEALIWYLKAAEQGTLFQASTTWASCLQAAWARRRTKLRV